MSVLLAFDKDTAISELLGTEIASPEAMAVPDFVTIQLDSFRWFQEEGLKELFNEISPIHGYSPSRFELRFSDYEFRQPQYTIQECLEQGLTYSAPLYVQVQLIVKETGEVKQQDLFFGDFPLMTGAGTFVISGAQRIVVSQLTRFPGVYFTVAKDPVNGREVCSAKLIPERGAWLDFDTSGRGVISVKVSGKRKIPVTTLLRAIGFEKDDQLLSLFRDVDTSPNLAFIQSTMERDSLVKNKAEALTEIYRKLSSGDPPSLSSAENFLNNMLFNIRQFNMGEVGRYKLSKKLGIGAPSECSALTPDDLVQIVRRIILINNGQESPDDIDHLGNRRAQTVGFLLQKQFRIGLVRLERVFKERMSIVEAATVTPAALVNVRPVVAAIREFFSRSQLSQFMDQTNPLSELTHKRRLSAMGPGGLSRERAAVEVRDVHYSHYGRLCPIETPEGPNIGLISSLATYARVNRYGFIETPYRKVIREVPNIKAQLLGRTVREDVFDDAGHLVVEAGKNVTEGVAEKITSSAVLNVQVVPFVSNQIVYLIADEEETCTIAQAKVALNNKGEFVERRIQVRKGGSYFNELVEKVDFMDVSPRQLFSVSASLIPFLEHDDANRALMGCNMQRQAVPLLRPHVPLVATGMEREVARDCGQVVFADEDGKVISVTSSQIVIEDDEGEIHEYPLSKFARTNQGTCINQRPVAHKADRVTKGDILADGFATQGGELALGQNIICAFMIWEGYNYEDAIVVSRRLVKDDVFTSIHIEKYEAEARDTKLGPEELTVDIPNVTEEALGDLDEEGIIRVGARVEAGDILVGKITPKGETELTAEEKLLRAIFGEKTRQVKDNSLRVPPGEAGRVIGVRVFSRDNHDELMPGVHKLVHVWVGRKRKLSIGDKMSGRHGNKGVVSIVVPEEDMPFLPDGTPVDMVLNPLGVPSRMNIGQVMETHLGWAAGVLGFQALTPIFDGASNDTIENALALTWIAWQAGAVIFDSKGAISGSVDWSKVKEWLSVKGFDIEKMKGEKSSGLAKVICLRLWLEESGVDVQSLEDHDLEQATRKLYKDKRLIPPIWGKTELRDGKTGRSFDQPVTVGNVYMMKLIHLVGDKVHARSIGPYSLITQQPLGGKAQFGGQRFGEMEVWALEGYNAAYTLQEMLTIKSDDVVGRAKAYEAIVRGEEIPQPGIPDSCKVLFMELRSLGCAVELLNEEDENLNLFGGYRGKPKAKLYEAGSGS